MGGAFSGYGITAPFTTTTVITTSFSASTTTATASIIFTGTTTAAAHAVRHARHVAEYRLARRRVRRAVWLERRATRRHAVTLDALTAHASDLARAPARTRTRVRALTRARVRTSANPAVRSAVHANVGVGPVPAVSLVSPPVFCNDRGWAFGGKHHPEREGRQRQRPLIEALRTCTNDEFVRLNACAPASWDVHVHARAQGRTRSLTHTDAFTHSRSHALTHLLILASCMPTRTMRIHTRMYVCVHLSVRAAVSAELAHNS
eukprot:6211719-Pleurochrysis_carterae.AAC.2